MIEYFNIFVLLTIFLLLLKEPRYRDLFWVKVFLIERSIYLLIFSHPLLYVTAIYSRFRFIFYLLLIAIIEEIVRKEMGKKTWWWAFPAVFIVIGATFFVTTGPPNYYIPRVIPLITGSVLLSWAIRKKHLIMFGFSFMASGWLISDIFKIFKPGPAIRLFQRNFDVWIDPLSMVIIAVGLIYLLAKKYVHVSFGAQPQAAAAGNNVVNFPAAQFRAEDSQAMTRNDVKAIVDDKLEDLENVLRAAAIATEIRSKVLLDIDDLMILLNATELEVEAFIAKNDIPKIEIAEGHWAVFKDAVFAKLGLLEE